MRLASTPASRFIVLGHGKTYGIFIAKRTNLAGVLRRWIGAGYSLMEIAMTGKLSHLRVAILATDGFEESELRKPREALDDAGARTVFVSQHSGDVRGWSMRDWGDALRADATLAEADPADFDALLLPGGVINPDRLRIDPKALAFIKAFVDADKPIAAICHGPWTLIDTGGVKGKRVTSWPSLATDLRNAGAQWVDEPVVTDRNLVTSRKPDDIPMFNEAMIALFAQRVKMPM
jgi:protease I